MKETMNDHRHVILPEIFKEKKCIEAGIGDFDVDCVLDEETQVNIMTKRTWELLGNPTMIPSLGGMGLFIGKLIILCGRLTKLPMTVNRASTKEDFEVIKFIEDTAQFTMLLGRPWIERDQSKRKEEEEVLEKKKQELKDLITRRIAHLIEEQENRSQPFHNNDLDFEVAGTLEDPQKNEISIPDKERILPLKESQQCEVTMSKEDKNQNGKRNTETKLTGKKARKLSKKRAKIEKLQKNPEETSQKEKLRNRIFVEISEQRHMALLHGEVI
jgi:hypothetical protein